MREKEQFIEKHVTFVGPQRGIPESRLQAVLISEAFRSAEVKRAYLVRVEYDAGLRSVALCLVASPDHQKRLVAEVGSIFSKMFSDQMHLDVIFPTAEQEEQLKKVAQSFYP